MKGERVRQILSVSSSKSPFGIIDDLANLINLITAGSIARRGGGRRVEVWLN